MDKFEVLARLSSAGLEIENEGRLPNGIGDQLRLTNGAIVNVFDNGNINVQGKNKAAVQSILGKEGKVPAANVPAKAIKHKVFVVYGHDQTSRDQLEAMLRRWGLEPLILDQLPTEGQTVIEKLEGKQSPKRASVLFSPRRTTKDIVLTVLMKEPIVRAKMSCLSSECC